MPSRILCLQKIDDDDDDDDDVMMMMMNEPIYLQ